MGKKFVGAFLLGGFVAFIWMMLSWMALPWHCTAFSSFKDEQAVATVIMENTDESGVFLLPNNCDKSVADDEHGKAVKQGPVIFASVQRDGFNYDTVYPYLTALITQWLGAIFIVLLLIKAAIGSYWGRVWFVTLIGLTIGLLSQLPVWNWWGFPFGFIVVEIADYVIGWWLAGLVIAAVTRPKKA